MFKSFILSVLLLLACSCQSKKNDQAVKAVASSDASATTAAIASTAKAKIDEALFTTPLGQRLKADWNPNPVSQGAIDQNIIVEYALKNNLDVKRTASGLYYTVEKEGQGASPLAQDVVIINYRGYTLEGTEFDSTYKRGEPLTYPVARFIDGWTEALQLMKPGEKIKLLVPSVLAYGQGGMPGSPIGPNTVLAFEMELLSVKK